MLLLISFIYKSHLVCILASSNYAKEGDSSKNMDQTHCYTFLSVNIRQHVTVATASSHTNRYSFMLVLKIFGYLVFKQHNSLHSGHMGQHFSM